MSVALFVSLGIRLEASDSKATTGPNSDVEGLRLAPFGRAPVEVRLAHSARFVGVCCCITICGEEDESLHIVEYQPPHTDGEAPQPAMPLVRFATGPV